MGSMGDSGSGGGGLTYTDLRAMLQVGARRRHELFDGHLVVTPSPAVAHQLVLARLHLELARWAEGTQWLFLEGPLDLVVTQRDVLVPDLVGFGPTHPADLTAAYIDEPPDLVVEIASASTRRRDLTEKAVLYEYFGVEEYWLIDYERPAVVTHRRVRTGFEPSMSIGAHTLTSPLLPGLILDLAALCTFA